MKSDEVFVRHMLDAISELQAMLGGLTYTEFEQDAIRVHASVRLLEIVGEAANKLSDEYRKANVTIPFADIIGMRNKLIHQYFEVDLEVLWTVYEEDLQSLEEALKNSLR